MKNTKAELKDNELEEVNGGDVTSSDTIGTAFPHNMPQKNPDEKYVMGCDSTDIQIIGACRPTHEPT